MSDYDSFVGTDLVEVDPIRSQMTEVGMALDEIASGATENDGTQSASAILSRRALGLGKAPRWVKKKRRGIHVSLQSKNRQRHLAMAWLTFILDLKGCSIFPAFAPKLRTDSGGAWSKRTVCCFNLKPSAL